MNTMNVIPLNATEATKAARGEEFTARCMGFARCTNPATTTVAHPVLGEVPCCSRCAAWRNK